jgi:hypothetical protein
MKKIILLMALTGLVCFSKVNAQSNDDGPKLGIGVDFAFPVGAYADAANYGVGGSLLYQHPLAENLRLTVNVGYLKFNGKEVFVGVKFREGYVPIKAGLKYFFTDYIYGAAEAGVAISTANGSGTGTAFAYSPGIGTELPVGKRQSLDFGVRYEGWSRSNGMRSLVGLRAGFNF